MRRISTISERHTPDHILGVISDTHGLLRPEAVAALKGSSVIVHAGDIGDPGILDGLGKIAPVIAVRGNTDRGRWARGLPETEVVEVRGIHVYVLHDVDQLDLDPPAAGFQVVISGHSHRPGMESRNGVLFLNPGSAGPRRFTLPVTLARLSLRDGRVEAEIVTLDV